MKPFHDHLLSLCSYVIIMMFCAAREGASMIIVLPMAVALWGVMTALYYATKGKSETVHSFLMALFIAFLCFHYAFDDIKKSLAISAGIFLINFSVSLLPESLQNKLLKFRKNIKPINEVVVQKPDENAKP